MPRATRIFYGLGEFGEGFEGTALDAFLFFFYIQVIGLSGAAVGAAVFIALLIDGITNPLVGALSDGLRSRMGRRHPFIFAAPLPLAIALFLLFSPPAGGSTLLLTAWLLGFAILCRIAFANYFIPHMALGAELTADFDGRLSVAAFRVVFSYLGRLIALFAAYAFFFHKTTSFANGQLNPAAYPGFALFCSGVILLAILISARGTLSRAVLMYKRTPLPDRFSLIHIPRNIGRAFQSRSFCALFVSLLILYVTTGVQGALALHMNTFFWQLKTTQIQLVAMSGVAGYIIGVPIASRLGRIFDKPRVFWSGILLFFVFTVGPTCLRLMGDFPGPTDPRLPTFLAIAIFLAGVVGAMPLTVSAAMIADLTDEFELKNGYRTEGFFFGLNAVTRKSSIGLGGAIAGIAIDWIRFPRHVEPGGVEQVTLNQLAVVYGPTIGVIAVIGLTVMVAYDLTRSKQKLIAKRLVLQRAERANLPVR
ncbi:MAG: MFS transporter [Rhizomicrobium sp.]